MTDPATHVESWLCRRLQEPALFAGVTTADERRGRLRDLIVRRDLRHAIVGRGPGGKPETWEELYTRLYGEPL